MRIMHDKNLQSSYTQQTQEFESTLVYCWSTVYDVGQTLNQHWLNVLCLLGTQSSQQDLRLIYISHSSRNMSLSQRHFNSENAEICLYKPWRQKGYFQFENLMNDLLSSFRFIWIPMLWVYDHQKYFYSFSAGIDFRRQNLTSTDVSFWWLKSIPAL